MRLRRRRLLLILLSLVTIVLVELSYSPGWDLVDAIYTRTCQHDCRPDVCNGCLKHDFEYLIQNSSICQTGTSGGIDLLIVITTLHEHLLRRNAIRETWLSKYRGNSDDVRYVFLLAATDDRPLMQLVYKESMEHGDILMENFTDSYCNLTHKTIMGIKWAASFCRHARFFMKTDHDMWVNVPRIVDMLNTRSEELQRSVGGRCFNTHPVRSSLSKWYTPVDRYPHMAYPKYCSGTGYVTSMSVVMDLNRIYTDIPFFEWEDVFVALCLKQLGMGVTDIRGFYKNRVTLDPCKMKSDVLTSHKVSHELMLQYTNASC